MRTVHPSDDVRQIPICRLGLEAVLGDLLPGAHAFRTMDGVEFKIVFTPAVPPERLSQLDLTPRQAEVALLLADNLSDKQIGKRLGISIHTVRRHSEQIFSRLGVNSRGQVAETMRTLVDG
jgi:DNA-binding CsgD family transcriptional regulator